MRYQLGDQVWSIEQRDAALVITEPDGVEHREQLPSAADAKRKLRILVNQRSRAGWQPVPAVADPAAAPATVRTFDARNPELEAAILDDPYNRGAWLVYADWLQLQGDPRGELIAVRAACEAAPGDTSLADRLRQLVERHGPALRGALKSQPIAWGFVDSLAIDVAHPVGLLALAEARFITKVETYTCEHVASIAATASRSLRELVVFDRHHTLSNLEPLVPRFAVLHKLDLDVKLAKRAVATLATIPMPHVRELALGTGPLAPIFATAQLPVLERLIVHATANGSLCGAISGASFLRSLRHLTLVDLDDDGAQQLIDHASRFQLTELALARSKLSARRALDLDAAFGNVGTAWVRTAHK